MAGNLGHYRSQRRSQLRVRLDHRARFRLAGGIGVQGIVTSLMISIPVVELEVAGVRLTPDIQFRRPCCQARTPSVTRS